MIPVIRPWLFPEKKVTNDEMFSNCYTCLEKDGRIVIYPEGTSVTVTKIRELKTGAARIKIGADKYLKGSKIVEIIPVGINYSNPRRFQSDVLVNVGSPINFEDIEGNEMDEKEHGQVMTDRIHEKMSELVLHYDDEDFTPLARKVSRVYGETAIQKLNIEDHETERKFRLRQGILNAILYFRSRDNDAFEIIKLKIERFFDKLDILKIDTRFLPGSLRFPLILFLKISLLAPLFAIGFVMNAVPFLITQEVFRRKVKSNISNDYEPGKLNPAFIGSLTFILGMAFFTLWYILLIIASWFAIGSALVIPGILLIGYLSGLITLRFARMNYHLSQRLRIRKLMRRKPGIYQNIILYQDEVLSVLDQYREEFQLKSI